MTDRFVSNFTNRLDAKGRVSIPSSFRSVLAKDGYEGLYVHQGLDLPALSSGVGRNGRSASGVMRASAFAAWVACTGDGFLAGRGRSVICASMAGAAGAGGPFSP